MKKFRLFYSLISIFIFTGCTNDNGTLVQCAAIDYAVPGLLIEIVDTNGNNLLDNETYNSNEISVVIDNDNISRIVKEDNRTYIIISLTDSIKNKELKVILSPSETDTMTVQLKNITTGAPCYFLFSEATGVIYNENSLPLEKSTFNQKITVVK